MTLTGWQTSLLNSTFSVIADLSSENLVVHHSGFVPIEKLAVRVGDQIDVKTSITELSEAFSAFQDGDFDLVHAITRNSIGTPFALKIWREISKVKPGTTITYAQLAKRAGNSAAVRAAGTACGRNPLPVFVPCHRIVPTGGGIGNYAFGSTIKAKLLKHESDRRHIQRSALRK